MRKVTLGLFLGILLTLAFFAGTKAHAQSGQVVFLGSTSGTTLAANCPAVPATPSLCAVGNGVYIWQNATTGWFQPMPPTTIAGVTGIIVCNAAGTSCGTAQSGTVTLNVPKTAATTLN